jgi:hypothetical protein
MQQSQAQSRIWKPAAFGGVMVSMFGLYEPTKDLYLKVFDADYKGVVSVTMAEQQLRLADKNADCFLNMKRSKVPVTDSVAIAFGACPNHNIHIAVYPKSKPAYQRWIEPNREQDLASLAGFFPAAYAGFSGTLPAPATPQSLVTPAQVELTNVCQEFEDGNKRKVLRITDEGGQCFFERVNIISGVVEVREPSACDSQCKVEAEKYAKPKS